MSSPYLLLVDSLKSIDASKSVADNNIAVDALDASPFDGTTIWGQGGVTSYNWANAYPTSKSFWPWVFISVMSGHYGIDVDDKYGGLTTWRTCFQAALDFVAAQGKGGIVWDAEPYNDPAMNDLTTAAAAYGVTEEHMRDGLIQIGSDMVDAIQATCPTVTIWSLFSPVDGTRTYSFDYITEGFLNRALELNSSCTFVSGAETQICYFFDLLGSFVKAGDYFIATAKAYQETYPQLKLAAPFFPWNDISQTTRYLKTWIDSRGANLWFRDCRHFRKLLDVWKAKFNYIWVYTNGANGYYPLDPTQNGPYNDILLSTKYRPCRCT